MRGRATLFSQPVLFPPALQRFQLREDALDAKVARRIVVVLAKEHVISVEFLLLHVGSLAPMVRDHGRHDSKRVERQHDDYVNQRVFVVALVGLRPRLRRVDTRLIQPIGGRSGHVRHVHERMHIRAPITAVMSYVTSDLRQESSFYTWCFQRAALSRSSSDKSPVF